MISVAVFLLIRRKSLAVFLLIRRKSLLADISSPDVIFIGYLHIWLRPPSPCSPWVRSDVPVGDGPRYERDSHSQCSQWSLVVGLDMSGIASVWGQCRGRTNHTVTMTTKLRPPPPPGRPSVNSVLWPPPSPTGCWYANTEYKARPTWAWYAFLRILNPLLYSCIYNLPSWHP